MFSPEIKNLASLLGAAEGPTNDLEERITDLEERASDLSKRLGVDQVDFIRVVGMVNDNSAAAAIVPNAVELSLAVVVGVLFVLFVSRHGGSGGSDVGGGGVNGEKQSEMFCKR